MSQLAPERREAIRRLARRVSRRAFDRLEFVLGALGLTAAALVFVIAVDAVQFHATALWRCLCHLDLRPVGADDLGSC